MKIMKRVCLLCFGLCALNVHAGNELSLAPLTGIEAFAQEPAMTSAQVSPDGKYLATIQRFRKDGPKYLLIYEVADMEKPPVTLASKKMEISSFDWVNNTRLVVRFRQDVDTLQRSGANTRQASKLATIDIADRKWLEIPRKRADRRSETDKARANFGGADIVSLMPWDKKHILITYDDDSNLIADLFKVNVETGAAKRVARGNNKYRQYGVDQDGEVRLASTYNAGENAWIYLARKKGSKKWQEIGRTVAGMKANSESFDVLGFYNKDDDNELLVLSNLDADTTGVFTYDLNAMKLGELLFRHPKYDSLGVGTVLDKDKRERVVAYSYTGKSRDGYYIDLHEKQLRNAIKTALPDTDNSIVSRSHDNKVHVIEAEGPKMPRSWYLLKDGKIDLIGRSMPFLTPDVLAKVEWVRYKARDGMSIPALVTIPDGDGPFPLVVMPHGGPVHRDYWGFDSWSQMIASHGYVVIQPQFRISEGFGKKHLEAGFARWGYEMQDDLEDAITYLDQRKLIDPNRVGIFGWSYGGYAAFMGSLRDPNPFKCAIAGAGVADLPYFRALLADNGDFLEKTYRKTVDGISPLDHVKSVDIPILVIHGDKDERVPVAESRKFVKKLKQYEKQYKYLELKGANHFYGTIFYRHYMKMFPAMIDWLDNTCGLKTPAAGQATGEVTEAVALSLGEPVSTE